LYHHDEEISLETEKHTIDYNIKIDLKGRSVDHGLDSTDSGWSTIAGSSESFNEPLCCMNNGEFHDQLGDYELDKDSAPWR
jgi:hypothetical protein